MPPFLIRFLKYFTVGFSTFVLDLGLLFAFTDWVGMNYIVATGLAYFLSVSLNYSLSRKYAFPDTLRRYDHGYYGFVLISISGLIFVVLLMPVLVEVFALPVLVARILIASIVGMWNYLMNLYVNFQVAERQKGERVS